MAMTVAEIIKRLRAVAEPVGPQHSFWEDIFDLEAMEAGKPTLRPIEEVRRKAETLRLFFLGRDYMDVEATVAREFDEAVINTITRREP